MKKALLVLFAMGWFLGGFAQEIEFETVEHDFGNVNYNDSAEYEFVFTNTGTESLIIQKPKSSSGHLIPSWPKDPILPGKKGVIKAIYKTNLAGKINKSITITSNAKNSPQIFLRVKGYVWEESMKVFEKNGYWGVEDSEKHVIIPFQYEELLPLKDNELLAKKNNKWGIIDKTNIPIIPCDYDELKLETDGKIEVIYAKKDGGWGLINGKNEAVTQFFAEEMKWEVSYPILLFFKFHIVPNKSELKNLAGKWGAITINGDLIIPPLFENISLVKDFADKYKYNGLVNRLDPEKEVKDNGKGLSSQTIIALQKTIKE